MEAMQSFERDGRPEEVDVSFDFVRGLIWNRECTVYPLIPTAAFPVVAETATAPGQSQAAAKCWRQAIVYDFPHPPAPTRIARNCFHEPSELKGEDVAAEIKCAGGVMLSERNRRRAKPWRMALAAARTNRACSALRERTDRRCETVGQRPRTGSPGDEDADGGGALAEMLAGRGRVEGGGGSDESPSW